MARFGLQKRAQSGLAPSAFPIDWTRSIGAGRVDGERSFQAEFNFSRPFLQAALSGRTVIFVAKKRVLLT
jgi:hypothetical protein